jgi:hypothetical protein
MYYEANNAKMSASRLFFGTMAMPHCASAQKNRDRDPMSPATAFFSCQPPTMTTLPSPETTTVQTFAKEALISKL